MDIDPKLIRSSYIGKQIKYFLNESDINITEIANKIGASRPSISNIINGKVIGSNNTYKKILKAIGLSDKKITEIFKEADKTEFKYKYGEDIKDDNILEDVDFNVALKKEFGKEMDQDTISKIKDFINYVNHKK